MTNPRVLDLGSDRQLLDLDFRDTEGLIAAYLLPSIEGWALVETGPTSCRSALLRGIARAGVDAKDVREVFVTHIHLDHAGGLGALADELPRATFFAHHHGVTHLIDPARHNSSSRRAWGPAADALWGPIVPVPAARVVALRGGERYPLRGGELRVLATPGHARHHVAYFDSGIRGVFTGDGAGVRLQHSAHVRPAVPPPDLDLEQLFASLETMRATDPALVLYSHFGPSPDGARDLSRYRTVVEQWRDVALQAARERSDAEYVERRLREFDAGTYENASEAERESLVSGYSLAAAGFLRYFETHDLLGRNSR